MQKIPKIYPPDETCRSALREFISHAYRRACVQTPAKSLLGRDIDLLTIGEGRENVLIAAAHHGAECGTATIVYYFILSLLEAMEKNEEYFGVSLSEYLARYKLWIIPAVNPDGIEISINGLSENPLLLRQKRMLGDTDHRVWQANARGVDINHNYREGFYEYKAIEGMLGITPGVTKYSGEYPESEPESAFVARLVRAISPSLVVSLHSQGEEIFAYPEGLCDSYAYRLEELLGYKISAPQGTARYGGLCDYTASLGIPSVTLEIGRGENPIFESEIWRIAEKLSKALFLLPLAKNNY